MLKQEDYFKTNNGYLTRSKISDYRLCPRYFFRKHIEGSIKPASKDHFVIGSATDYLLAQIDSKNKYHIFDGDFRTKANRDMRDALQAEGKIVIKQDDYDRIMALAIAVEETEAYQALNSYPRQVLLQSEWRSPTGHFQGIAALPDFAKITDTSADLCDLKTAANFRLNKWLYTAREHGYLMQFALQTLILRRNNNNIKNFTYRHLVVDKTEHINNVYAIMIDPELIEEEMDYLPQTIEKIMTDKTFKKASSSWAHAYYLENESFE